MFNGKQKAENQRLAQSLQALEKDRDALKARLAELNADSVEEANAQLVDAKERLACLEAETAAKEEELKKLEDQVNELLKGKDKIETYESLVTAIMERQQILSELDDAVLMESYALYSPQYAFRTSEEYLMRMEQVRAKQRDMLRSKKAVAFVEGWEIDGSKELGQKLNDDNIQKLIRGFNAECDLAVKSVRFNNFDRMEERIKTSFDTLNTLNEMSQVSVTPEYLELKLEELRLAYEYQQKLNEEAVERRNLREQQRQEAKARQELDGERKKLNEEKAQLQDQLAKAQEEADRHDPEQFPEFSTRLSELQSSLEELEKKEIRLKASISGHKAGFLYVLSNLGAFGENVFKLGMTRRLDTEAFVDEFNSPAVPFDFDLHAMLYSDDAREIWEDLRQRLSPYCLNAKNPEKGFYRIEPALLKQELDRAFGKCVEFDPLFPAKQYRDSLRLKTAQREQD